jgi:hypothetical protein
MPGTYCNHISCSCETFEDLSNLFGIGNYGLMKQVLLETRTNRSHSNKLSRSFSYFYVFYLRTTVAARGPRHELSRALGSWVRIPLEGWISVSVYSVFVLSCVWLYTLRQVDIRSKELYQPWTRFRNWKIGEGSPNGLQRHNNKINSFYVFVSRPLGLLNL